jgi:ABC-type uncharacterized transport system substrate-binding protein
LKNILIYLIFFITELFAHPHTFIDVYPTIKVKEHHIEFLNFKWKIDEMTSSMLIMDIDQDGDSKISSKESEYIRDNYFNVFKDYGYYTFIRSSGVKVGKFIPKNFVATIEENRVCYSFDIDLNVDIDNFSIEFGDSDFYVAMILKDKFIDVSGATANSFGVDNDFYYGYKLELK